MEIQVVKNIGEKNVVGIKREKKGKEQKKKKKKKEEKE